MKLIFSFCFCWVFLPILSSGFEVYDVKSLSLGRLNALGETLSNPSALSFQEKRSVGISVQNHFCIKELNTCSTYVLFPDPRLACGFGISGYGFENYRLWMFRSAFSKKIHSKLSLGVGFSYEFVSGLYDDNIAKTIGANFGLSFFVSEYIQCVLLFENFVNELELWQKNISGGMKYILSKDCCLFLEGKSDFLSFQRISAGTDYELLEQFHLRAGFYSNPLTPTFGLSFTTGNMLIDVACDKHSYLGYSTSLGIAFQF